MARQWSILLSVALPEPGEELSPYVPAASAVGTREEVLAKADDWMREQERQMDELAGKGPDGSSNEHA